MKVHQINISPRGGVPKLRVPEAFVATGGVVGDRQRDRRFHGGPMRAVCLFSRELIEELHGDGHPIEAGSLGENLTLAGIDWQLLRPGVRLHVGECELEITFFVPPCKKIASSFSDGDFKRLSHKRNPYQSRLYARVLLEGTVREGDAVEVLDSPEFDRTPLA